MNMDILAFAVALVGEMKSTSAGEISGWCITPPSFLIHDRPCRRRTLMSVHSNRQADPHHRWDGQVVVLHYSLSKSGRPRLPAQNGLLG